MTELYLELKHCIVSRPDWLNSQSFIFKVIVSQLTATWISFKDIDSKDSKMWVSANFYLFTFNSFTVFFTAFSSARRPSTSAFNSSNCWVKWAVKDCHSLLALWFGISHSGLEFNSSNSKSSSDSKSDLKVLEQNCCGRGVVWNCGVSKCLGMGDVDGPARDGVMV